MKYLLVAHYAGFDLDDPEDLVNNAWTVCGVDTLEQAVEVVRKEVEAYINEQAELKFDLDDPESYTEEELAEFKDSYEVSVFSQAWPENFTMLNIGEVYLDAEYYFEDLKFELIKLN